MASDAAAVGTVSRFDDAAGYGFIAADAGGPHLFFRGANIAAAGRTSLRDGERVEFEPREGGMGPEAMNVLPLPDELTPTGGEPS